jgi:hypothetical protein
LRWILVSGSRIFGLGKEEEEKRMVWLEEKRMGWLEEGIVVFFSFLLLTTDLQNSMVYVLTNRFNG